MIHTVLRRRFPLEGAQLGETDAVDTFSTAADVDFAAIQPEVEEGLREDLVMDLAGQQKVDAKEVSWGEAVGKERERMVSWDEARQFLARGESQVTIRASSLQRSAATELDRQRPRSSYAPPVSMQALGLAPSHNSSLQSSMYSRSICQTTALCAQSYWTSPWSRQARDSPS